MTVIQAFRLLERCKEALEDAAKENPDKPRISSERILSPDSVAAVKAFAKAIGVIR